MTDMIDRAGLRVAAPLVRFVEEQVLPDLAIEPKSCGWRRRHLARFTPQNAALLLARERDQTKIDGWHAARRGAAIDPAAYRGFF